MGESRPDFALEMRTESKIYSTELEDNSYSLLLSGYSASILRHVRAG